MFGRGSLPSTWGYVFVGGNDWNLTVFQQFCWHSLICWLAGQEKQISRWFQPRQDLEATQRQQGKLSTEEVGPGVVVWQRCCHWRLMISYVTSLKLTYSPLKIGHPKRKRSYSNHPFSGAMLVSGRVISRGWHSKPWQKLIYQLKGARSVAEMHQNSGQCESKCVRCQESCKFGGRVVVAVDLLIFFTWFMTYDIYSIMGGFAMFFGGSLGGACASTGRAHYVSVAPDPQNWTFLLMEEMLHQLRLKTSNIVRYVCRYCHAGFLPSTVFHFCLAMETGDFGVEWIIQKKRSIPCSPFTFFDYTIHGML